MAPTSMQIWFSAILGFSIFWQLNGKLASGNRPKLSAISGETVWINCPVYGYPVDNITWEKGDDILPAHLRQTILHNGTLRLENVQRGVDSGRYTCSAHNNKGESAQGNVDINVMVPPKITPFSFQEELVHEGSRARLQCVVNEGDTPMTITWLKDGEPVPSTLGVTVRDLDEYSSILMMSAISPRHNGNYTCVAANDVATSRYTAKLAVNALSGPPLNVEIESVDKRSIRITWKPPDKSTWNGIIRGYRIGYKVSGSSSPFNFISIEIPEDYMEDLFYQLTELEMYTQYVIIVQAYNKKDNGPSSPEIQVMTSEDVPKEAPRNVRCSPLSTNTIYIIWDGISPENTNGILRGYKVFYKSVDDWHDTSHHSKTSETPKLMLQGLEVNTKYSIEVAAFTNVGDGSRSQAIFCKTHEDVPSAPGDIKVLPFSSDAVLVAWKPPMKPNGVVTKYNVYVRPVDDDEESGSEIRYSIDAVSKPDAIDDTDTRDDLVYYITGLEKNLRYEFWITAVSGVGEGPRSRVVNQLTGAQTIAAQSAMFDDVIKTPWNRDLTLNCRAVGFPQPSKSWIKGGQSMNPHDRMQVEPDGSLVIQKVNLEDSGNYTCQIQNKYGTDEVKYAVVVLVPPSAPTLGVYSKSTTSLQLKWQAGSTGGDPLTGYLLYYRKDNDKWEKRELYADQESHMLENLACGATYQIYMEPINNIGVGESSDIINITTDGDALEPPAQEDLIHESSTFLSLHFDSWPSTGCPIKNFTVEYRKVGTDEWIVVKKGIKPIEKMIVIPDLSHSTFYQVRVTAFINGGSTVGDYVTATLTLAGGVFKTSDDYVPPNHPGGIELTAEDYTQAQKYCKSAESALQYEDAPTAIENLQKALKLLTTGQRS